jgi:TetR/AcrR family transcriptional repressor of nem operon
MARTKEFDPDAVLQAALELFWQRGYAATSMSDLVEHLGIGRASIYATFGNKHDLYLEALDRYVESQHPSPVELLSRPGPALPAVRALIRRYADEAVHDERQRGCLVVNTATELVPRDEGAARRVQASWGVIETAVESALSRARAQGELAADADVRALARFVLVVLQGLKVVGKGAPDAARLHDAAEQAVRLLE